MEDSFGLKRFQGDGGVVGVGKERRNCYGNADTGGVIIFSLAKKRKEEKDD